MEHVESGLPDLLRNDLPALERERIETHIVSCPSCRARWDEISILSQEGRSPSPPAPDGYFATLPSRILQRRQEAARHRWTRPLAAAGRVVMPVAAGMLVVILLARVSFPTPEAVPPDRIAVPLSDVVEYVAGESGWITAELSPVAEPLMTDRAILRDPFQDHDVAGLEDLEPTTVLDAVADLNEDQVEQLIARLSERTIL